MSTVRHLPSPAERARTYAAMATERHRLAVTRKLAGDIAGHDEAMADVRGFDEKTAEERARQTVIEDQENERRRKAAALLAGALEVLEREGAI